MSEEALFRPSRDEHITFDKRVTDSSQPLILPLDKVEAAIRSIQYGVVQIIIQDGRIVQIDKTEKIRLK